MPLARTAPTRDSDVTIAIGSGPSGGVSWYVGVSVVRFTLTTV